MARMWVQREAKKPLLGKPHIRFGQAATIAGHLFQQSALLGHALNSARAPFLTVFCATEEPSEEVAASFAKEASDQVLPYLEPVDSITDLIMAMLKDRVHGEGDMWFLRHGTAKISLDAGVTLAYDYELIGAGFGMQHADRFEALFDNTYKRENPEEWRKAFELGVVDAPEQEDVSMEEWQQDALQLFTEYCEEFYPQLLQPLRLVK